MINTGAATDALLEVLAFNGVLEGDGRAPQGGGWAEGTPNVDQYVPYTVLAFGGAVPVMENLGPSRSEWETFWGLRHFGGSRAQADHQAALAREVADDQLGLVAGDYKVIGVRWQRLGALAPDDSISPPIWRAEDTLVLVFSA